MIFIQIYTGAVRLFCAYLSTALILSNAIMQISLGLTQTILNLMTTKKDGLFNDAVMSRTRENVDSVLDVVLVDKREISTEAMQATFRAFFDEEYKGCDLDSHQAKKVTVSIHRAVTDMKQETLFSNEATDPKEYKQMVLEFFLLELKQWRRERAIKQLQLEDQMMARYDRKPKRH